MVFYNVRTNWIIMKKLLFLLLLLPFFASAQTTYLLNYDSIRVGRADSSGGIGLSGSVYLKKLQARSTAATLFLTRRADGLFQSRTPAQVRSDIGAGTGSGTVTSVAALTLGTTGTDLSSSVANSTTTPVITLNVPTASASNRGALSSTDWSTFNNKQAAYAGLQDSITKKANRTFDNVASGAIANAKLANSTISGVTLGNTLNALTGGYGITSSGTYTGAIARTFNIDTSGTIANKTWVNGRLTSYLPLAGGALTGTVSNTGVFTSQSAFAVVKDATASILDNYLMQSAAGSNRWAVASLGTESGGGSGSGGFDWVLRAYDNSGANLGAKLTVSRAGTVTASTFAGALSGNATSATAVGVTNDNTTNDNMFPTWVTTTSGNLPIKVSSSKISFNPSTGYLNLSSGGLKLTSPNSSYSNTMYVDNSGNWKLDNSTVGNLLTIGDFEIGRVSTTYGLTVGSDLIVSGGTILGGASNMTITSGTGASRTMIFKTTTSGSSPTTALTLGADQSTVAAGTLGINGTTDNVKSIEFTSAGTSVVNVASITGRASSYMRVGDWVTVSGSISITPTSAGVETAVNITLPISSNLASAGQCNGTAISSGEFKGAVIYGDATNDKAQIDFLPGTNAAQVHYFTFMYKVI